MTRRFRTLNAVGCDKIFAEKVSSVAQRAELEAALDYAREGDALVVTKLDRLARSVAHLVSIGERFSYSSRPGLVIRHGGTLVRGPSASSRFEEFNLPMI